LGWGVWGDGILGDGSGGEEKQQEDVLKVPHGR
jgi:hypothetical protein